MAASETNTGEDVKNVGHLSMANEEMNNAATLENRRVAPPKTQNINMT